MLSTPRVIFKCPHIKGGGEKAAAHLGNYVKYVSTREGVDRIDPGKAALPATEKQAELVEQLLREFPSSRGLFEYEDYQAAPTRGNASEFITRAIEDNYESVAKRENYVDYIAMRPRVQKLGTHGLFTAGDGPLVLSQVAEEVARHPGVVWLPIISLRRKDAARLGFDNAERWRKLLSSRALDMAKAMKIPDEQFRWYAAFHDEGHHPHVHMVCYSADARSGFLTKQGITKIKSMLAQEIFQQDLIAIYQRQTQRREGNGTVRQRDADWDAGQRAHRTAYGRAGPASAKMLREKAVWVSAASGEVFGGRGRERAGEGPTHRRLRPVVPGAGRSAADVQRRSPPA